MRTAKLLTAAIVAVSIGTAFGLAQDKRPAGPPISGAGKSPTIPATIAAEKYEPDMKATEFPNLPNWRKIALPMPKVQPTDDPATKLRKKRLLNAHEEIKLRFDRYTPRGEE